MVTWNLTIPKLTVILLGGLLAGPLAAAELTAEQQAAYRDIRKGLMVALALPARPGQRPRKEHRAYYEQLKTFVESLPPEAVAYRTAARYYEARLFMHTRHLNRAREAFAAYFEMRAQLADPEVLPADVPNANSVRLLQALAHDDLGSGAVLEQLGELREDAAKPRYLEVGEMLYKWAEQQAQETRFDDAIAAFEVVRKWGLWEEDWQDPQKKIALLKYAKENPQ